MGDSRVIQTELGDVTVHKMPLSDYGKLLQALDSVPQTLIDLFDGMDAKTLQSMSNTQYAMLLPRILASSWDELIGVIAVPTNKDQKFIAKLDLADAIDVVEAILELNDIARIMAAVKKMLALQSKMAVTKPKQI